MIYTAKCFWPGVTEHQLEQAAALAVRETATASRIGSAIAYLGSILFEDDELVLCLFDAPSRAAVRTATERAGIPCERVIDSHWLPPPRPQPPTTLEPGGRHDRFTPRASRRPGFR